MHKYNTGNTQYPVQVILASNIHCVLSTVSARFWVLILIILITNSSKKCQLLWFLDKVPESPDNTKTQVAEAAQDLQAAREDAEARADEHQRGHLGQTPQEEHQAGR